MAQDPPYTTPNYPQPPSNSLATAPPPPPSSSSSSSQPPLVPPQYQQPAAAYGQPAYNVLPNGQVQLIYTIPPQAAQQFAAQQQYGAPPQQFPQQQYGVPPQQFPQQQYAPYQAPVYTQYVYPAYRPYCATPSSGLGLTCLITYIVGLFTFVPHIVSIITSFHMANVGYFTPQRKAVVIICGIFELLAWLFVPAFSWFGTEDCNYYGGYYSYYNCYYMWWGWISLIVWFVVGLAFGIPRVIYSFNAKRPDSMQPISHS